MFSMGVSMCPAHWAPERSFCTMALGKPAGTSRSQHLCGGIDMTLSVARHIVLAARPQGTPHVTDFRLEDTALPTPAAGQLLLGVQYLSLDPYMRLLMEDRPSDATPLPLGAVMPGEAVAQVLTSHHPAYAAGDLVLAPTGWRTHALSDGTGLRQLDPAVAPVTTALGVLGMPGFTAYAGVRLIGTPRPRDTVVVAAASGPVGSLVGQLAQLAGARAVGIAGSAEKCAFVQDGLPATMRAILSKRLTLRGFLYHECAAAHYPAFLREVGAGIATGRIRYREDIVDGLEQAPGAFLGLLEGRNFGKVIVRVDA